MKKLISMKRAAASCCAVAMAAASLSGCGSAGYALKYGDTEIKPGVYIASIMNEMNTQMNTLYYAGKIQSADDCFDQEIDGKKFAEAVKEKALESSKEIVAIDAKFKELGLELSAEDVDAIEESLSSTWGSNGGLFEYAGVSKESYKLTLEDSYKKTAIFNYYYAENGIEEVGDETIQSYVNDNYIRYKMLSIPKSSAEDEETKKTENEEAEALFNEYLEKAKDVDFAGFDALIDEYNAYKEAKEAEETAAAEGEDGSAEAVPDDSSAVESTADTAESTADSAESADSTETSETSEAEESAAETEESAAETPAPESVPTANAAAESETEEESTAEESAAEDASSEEESKAEDESAADESTADSESATDTKSDAEETADTETTDETDSAAEEEEDDPYVNEYVMNATDLLDTESDSYDATYAKLVQAVKDAEYGKATSYTESEYSYVIFITADIAERPDYIQDNKDTLLQEIKGDEFDGLVAGWVEALDIKVNEKAVKKYSVKDIYDRQKEYAEKNPQS